MFWVFFLLFAVSLIALIVGLIKPTLVVRWGEDKTRGKVIKLFGAATVLLFILSMATTPKLTPEQKAAMAQRKEEAKIAAEAKKAAQETQKTEETKVKEEAAAAKKAEGVKQEPAVNNGSWATAEITEDTIKKALAGKSDAKPTFTDSNFPKDITEIRIIDIGEGKKNIWIYYKPKSSWDETHLVKMAGSTAIFGCSLLYQNAQVGDVAFFTQGDFTDQYGKSKTDVAVKLVITSDLAKKVDWKGLAEMHESDPGNIYRISENYNIHLGVKKNIKSEEISL